MITEFNEDNVNHILFEFKDLLKTIQSKYNINFRILTTKYDNDQIRLNITIDRSLIMIENQALFNLMQDGIDVDLNTKVIGSTISKGNRIYEVVDYRENAKSNPFVLKDFALKKLTRVNSSFFKKASFVFDLNLTELEHMVINDYGVYCMELKEKSQNLDELIKQEKIDFGTHWRIRSDLLDDRMFEILKHYMYVIGYQVLSQYKNFFELSNKIIHENDDFIVHGRMADNTSFELIYGIQFKDDNYKLSNSIYLK